MVTNSSCALSQPNRKQEDQKTSWLKVKKNGSKTLYVIPGRKDHGYIAKGDSKSQYV